jgi:hypothetical protein
VSSQELRHAVSGVALAERLDIFILYRGRLGRPPERLALTRPEIDALYQADLLELHIATATRTEPARPFYRGFPVVEQGSKT